MIGYRIEQELGNLLPADKPLVSLLTMTLVDADDPAFADPTKFCRAGVQRRGRPGARGGRGWTVRRTAPAGDASCPQPCRGGSSRIGLSSGSSPRTAGSFAPEAAGSRRCSRRAPEPPRVSRRSSTRTGPAPSWRRSCPRTCSSSPPMPSTWTGAPRGRARRCGPTPTPWIRASSPPDPCARRWRPPPRSPSRRVGPR